jgi:rod shape-determining protein MreC
MEALLSRYRNVTVLLLVIVAQLLLLAFQVKSNQDVRLIRIWSVTAITPFARILEGGRSNTFGFFKDYVFLRDVREENQALRTELGKLKLENQFLKSELEASERASALAAFQARSPSKTIAARVIATGTGANSKAVFVDRGSNAGVLRGMAVVTPDGIVGKVLAAYPTASQVLLVTDPTFAAGVISQKNRIQGTLKGQGHGTVLVDYIQNEQPVEVGEWFYTSGDDRVFPKGLLVGEVKVVRVGKTFKEILVMPSGVQGGLEEVLIMLEGVHQMIPEQQEPAPGIHIMPAPPADTETSSSAPPMGVGTDADRLFERYKKIGEVQNHTFGEGGPGARPPNFNLDPNQAPAPKRPVASGSPDQGSPSVTGRPTQPPNSTGTAQGPGVSEPTRSAGEAKPRVPPPPVRANPPEGEAPER